MYEFFLLEGALTSVSSIHVGDQGWAEGVEVRDHLGVLTHFVQLGNGQIGLPKTGGCGSCTSLEKNNALGECRQSVSKRNNGLRYTITYHIHGIETQLNGRPC